jgi:hypothetical protein
MRTIDRLLDKLYTAQERLSRQEIHRRAVAEELPPEAVLIVDALPEGEYTQDEAAAALAQLERDEAETRTSATDASGDEGVPADYLSDDDLHRELGQLHRTRDTTFRRGSDQALETHTARTEELEAEYLRRYPERETDPERMREGARRRRGRPT